MERLIQNRLFLAAITTLLLLIPLSSYLMVQRAQFEHLLDEPIPKPSFSPIPEVSLPKTNPNDGIKEINNSVASLPSPTPGYIIPTEPAVLGATATPSSGLKLRIKMADRPVNNQTTRVFVGIGKGETISDPKYLLSFLVDLDPNGQYSGISLTGLEPNSVYTAYIKGISELATTREFSYQSGLTDLGLIPLITGDVNNDNIIDSQDADLVKQNIGKTSTSANFDPKFDLNKDGLVNSIDLTIVTQNLGKTGEAGVVIPSQLNNASRSAELQTSSDLGGPEGTPSATALKNGYWLWIPKVD